jgi:hypothetical protein
MAGECMESCIYFKVTKNIEMQGPAIVLPICRKKTTAMQQNSSIFLEAGCKSSVVD